MIKTGSEPIHRLQNNEILHCILNTCIPQRLPEEASEGAQAKP